MTSLRALVVDDEAPARERMRRLLSRHGDVTCVGECGDGLAALTSIEELRPDLVFLDIEMPVVDGLTVAASLPPSGPEVVFATAFDQHALRAFELAAIDYLLKPVTAERLAASLERVRARREAAVAPRPAELARAVLEQLAQRPRRMAVRCGSKYEVFDVARISAIVAQDHYAAITVDGRELLSDDSLDTLAARLEDAGFARVHRGAIVNLRMIGELQHDGDRKYACVLTDAARTRVPVARDRLDGLKAQLGIG
jgi:two-component system, LytTR family, response regulator